MKGIEQHQQTVPTVLPVRNLVHLVGACVVAFASPMVSVPTLFGGLVALTLVVCIVQKHLHPLSLYSTRDGSYGEYYFIAGIFIAAILFSHNTPAWYAAMFTLAFADTGASYIGEKFGRRRFMFRGEDRSWEGTMTCASITAFIFIYMYVPIIPGLVAGICVACVEVFSTRGSDNLTVPLTAGVLMSIYTAWY